MAILLSSEIVDGDPFTADQINRLVEDLSRIHAHTSDGDGADISHGNLSDSDGTHAAIDIHISGTDNPGGSAGVHGLPSTRFVLGTAPDQWEIRWGTLVTDRWDDTTYEQRGKADIGLPRLVEYPAIALFQTIRNDPTSHCGNVSWLARTENSVSAKVFCKGVTTKTAITLNWLILGKVPQ